MFPFANPKLVLLHPPGVYDFREGLNVPSPIADLIPSGTVFEMYPVGFSFLGEYLERHGVNVRVVNLAARMLEDDDFDVESFVAKLHPRAFGIDLHWLPHCHGSIEVAKLCKKHHPDTPVIMGGYSASIFARDLLAQREVDFVIRGDSAEEPLLRLMRAIETDGPFDDVPNLTYRDKSGGIIENELSCVPGDLGHLGNNYRYMIRSAIKYGDIKSLRAFKGWWSYPLTAVVTVRGCRNDCAFCGGSAHASGTCFNRARPAYRTPEAIAGDVRAIARFTGAPIFIIGDLRQNGGEYSLEVLDALGSVRPCNHVVLELFGPAPRSFFERASRSLPNFDLEISPETHDEELRRMAGKPYANAGLEATLRYALECGCARADVFFMIGIRGQTPESVRETTDYGAELLRRFGPRLNPLIGPLAPFLDPGSISHDSAGELGYRLFCHNLEDYRNAMLEPHWRDMLSYETEWMSRADIVDATYEALLVMNRAKAEAGRSTRDFMDKCERFLNDSTTLLRKLDAARAAGEDWMSLKVDADALRAVGALVKEELRWPVEGRRFRYPGIVWTILGR